MNRETIIRSCKITAGAIIAILIATLLGLKYSATAGIITILSLQTTKRETLQTAAGRSLAFLCALVIAAVCYHLIGFQILAFGVYLLIFSLLCLIAGWASSISLVSVLITHFLTEQSMAFSLIFNEILIFLIGTSIGILLNLHLRPKQKPWRELADKSDETIRHILQIMAIQVCSKNTSESCDASFQSLKKLLSDARALALSNIQNTLFSPSYYELDYIEMRQKQMQVLTHIDHSLRMITIIPKQAEQIASFLEKISLEYHMENNVKSLLFELETILLSMKKEPLPQFREEFENRAVLFYILKQLEEFLLTKQAFAVKYQL